MFSHFLQSLFLLSAPGGSEWILIILAVLILFGGRKIPEFMRGLGRGMREFNDAKNNVKKEFEDGMNEPRESTPPVTSTPTSSATQTSANNSAN
ncbi:MAG: twin-arginine translocase TatA/TatE family subunit [Bacteroidota bacterium]|nr:twin-arginine translocase TatA/TatE family subunit [Bacteroidota bacterium]MDP4211175.1 twin-arginine translocase TatA/TatE family subunit [Bacteroidota bacterium]MDP4249426.1 twin-arginine translocase TatA/TatE family subunit [Bacteroidota bacterium]